MELTVQNVFGLLLRSKLMSAEDARAMFQRWQTEAGDTASNLPHFLKWLVHRQYLTEYQAALLGRGHAEGFVLNDYTILDRLGKGRMAGVYRARHRLGQTVALKVLPPSKAKDPQFLGRFQREARLASRLHHPNIVRVFQVGQSGHLHYFVMEHLVGETLDEVLARRGPLPPTEAVRLVYFALLGLQHIHSRGMVHRDMKPANLMLIPRAERGPNETTLRSQLKILDVGLARSQSVEPREGDGDPQDEEPQLTTEGVLLGTPDYMAPEQARDARTADIRSDIYSMGCVLYHALAGQPPFPDTNLINQMIRHATEPPRPLAELNAAVPDGLQQIVNWMLAKNPNQRYPTPERAAQALQMFLASGSLDSTPSKEPDANMKSYLDWLDVEYSKETIELTPTPAAPAPLAPSEAATLPPVKVGSGTHPVARKHEAPGKSPEKPSRPRSADVPVAAAGPVLPTGAPSAAPAIPEFDVELVPAAAPTRKRGQRSPFQLTPRDFIMFGIGVGGTLLAIVAAMLLASLLARKPASTHEGTPPEPTTPQGTSE